MKELPEGASGLKPFMPSPDCNNIIAYATGSQTGFTLLCCGLLKLIRLILLPCTLSQKALFHTHARDVDASGLLRPSSPAAKDLYSSAPMWLHASPSLWNSRHFFHR